MTSPKEHQHKQTNVLTTFRNYNDNKGTSALNHLYMGTFSLFLLHNIAMMYCYRSMTVFLSCLPNKEGSNQALEKHHIILVYINTLKTPNAVNVKNLQVTLY